MVVQVFVDASPIASPFGTPWYALRRPDITRIARLHGRILDLRVLVLYRSPVDSVVAQAEAAFANRPVASEATKAASAGNSGYGRLLRTTAAGLRGGIPAARPTGGVNADFSTSHVTNAAPLSQGEADAAALLLSRTAEAALIALAREASVLPPHLVHRVRYERVLRQPTAVALEVAQWLQVDGDDAVVHSLLEVNTSHHRS